MQVERDSGQVPASKLFAGPRQIVCTIASRVHTSVSRRFHSFPFRFAFIYPASSRYPARPLFSSRPCPPRSPFCGYLFGSG